MTNETLIGSAHAQVPLEFQEVDELVAQYLALERSMEAFQDKMGRIEHALVSRMREKGATRLPHDTQNIELKYKVTYDQGHLEDLKCVIPEAELDEFYSPAYQETVERPARWNMRLKKRILSYGDKAKMIVARATITAPASLSIKPKETNQ